MPRDLLDYTLNCWPLHKNRGSSRYAEDLRPGNVDDIPSNALILNGQVLQLNGQDLTLGA